MEILDTCNVYSIYYIDTQNRTAAVSVGIDEEDTARIVMETMKVAQENNSIELVENATIVEVVEKFVKYNINDEHRWNLVDQRYHLWSFLKNAYGGKPGFRIDEIDTASIVEFLEKRKAIKILVWLDNKLIQLIQRGIIFKKSFSILAKLFRVYFLISQDYYEKL